jgi:hypothetical protein
MRPRLPSVVLAGILASAPAIAAGVDPANASAVQREQAQARFLKGKSHFDRGHYEDALTDFRASYDIVASPNARLYVARTLREMGRLVEAYAEFGRTAAEAKEHEHEDGRYGKAATAALAERASIAPQLAFVELHIANATDTTTVAVAGSSILHAGWSEPVPVKPGTVEVEVETPGVLHIHKSVSIRAGDTKPVTVDAGVAANNTETKPPPPPDTGKPSGKGWMLPVAIAGGGVGVVGMLMFTIAGVASSNTYSDLKSKCGLAMCPPSLQGEVSSGKTQQAVANTGLVIGLVGLAVGATFLTIWLLPSHAASPSAALVVGPGSLSIAGTF